MKVLQIFKSEPDETVEELRQAWADDEVIEVNLYEGDEVDWARVVETIFASDTVVCWW